MPHPDCRHPHEDLVLYVYDELEAADRDVVAARLAQCPACRAVHDELTALRRVALPVPEVHERDALRREVMARIQAARRPPVRRPGWTGWRTPAFRLALAVLLVAVGFWGGRRSAGPAEPPAAAVRAVTFDPATGTLAFRVQTLDERTVTGRPGDPAIRRLMQAALRTPENPGARLDAIRALDALAPAPDSALVEALAGLLTDEPNDGIRIQALRALRTLHRRHPLTPTLKRTLLDVLRRPNPPALRIEALQALTEGAVLDQELTGALEAMRHDTNAFIRYRAGQVLDGRETPGPLERLPNTQPREVP